MENVHSTDNYLQSVRPQPKNIRCKQSQKNNLRLGNSGPSSLNVAITMIFPLVLGRRFSSQKGWVWGNLMETCLLAARGKAPAKCQRPRLSYLTDHPVSPGCGGLRHKGSPWCWRQVPALCQQWGNFQTALCCWKYTGQVGLGDRLLGILPKVARSRGEAGLGSECNQVLCFPLPSQECGIDPQDPSGARQEAPVLLT